MLTRPTLLDEIYNSAYALVSCPSSSKRTRSTGSGDLMGSCQDYTIKHMY